MRILFAPVLSLSLVVASLAGCAQAPAPTAAAQSSLLAAQAKRSSQQAKAFAELLKPRFTGKIAVRGAIVTVTSNTGETASYNFSAVGRTGLVKVTAGDATFEVRHADLIRTTTVDGAPADALPVLLVPIAIHVAVGGSIALAQYAITHPGDKFDKEEAVKATVVGMVAALTPFVRDVQYVKYLVPLAVMILNKAESLHYKDIVAAAMAMKNDIIQVLMRMLAGGGHQPKRA